MIDIRVIDDGTLAALRQLPIDLAKESKDHMEVIGVYLLSEVKLDFETKSRGGTSNNIKWEPLKESTERAKARKGGWKPKSKDDKPPKSQINVDTGLLRNSPSPGFTASDFAKQYDITENSVTVGYGMNYAEHVDEKRTLIPDETPKEWIEEAEEMTKEWLEEMIQKGLQ